MKNHHQAGVGQVIWYDEAKNLGKIKVEWEPVGVEFSLDTLTAVKAGFKEPEFAVGVSVSTFLPRKGDVVYVRFAVGYTLTSQDHPRTLRRTAFALLWSPLSDYRQAERVITSRPTFQVVEFALYKGVPTSTENQRRIIATGTAIELQAISARRSKNDRFAPEVSVMDMTTRRRFYKQVDGEWIQCEDPRPLPAGAIAEPFQETNQCGVLLAVGTELVSLMTTFPFKRAEPRQLVAA